MEVALVETTLQRLYLGDGGLRREDLKKAREIAALLDEIARVGKRGWIVDAAAGHTYAGLLAVELLGVERLLVLERDAQRLERTREAARRLTRVAEIELRAGLVGDRALWPAEPQLVVALHACGAASDEILDAAVACRARWLLLVPCCYAEDVPSMPRAEVAAVRLGISGKAEIRRRFLQSFVDSERALRLEAAGYDVTVSALVPPSVTPHNLLFRARRVGEPGRMAAAAAQLEKLRG
jgi:hypothetical protein